MKTAIKVISSEGYDDGYYWDERVVFEYKGKAFSFINVGSGSGWIPFYRAIGYSDISEALCSKQLDNCQFTTDDTLMKYAEMLLDSGKDELDWSEEE